MLIPTPKYAPADAYNNPYGYVAIELYNPYDQDISLKNWKIVAIDRRSQPAGWHQSAV